MPTTTTLTIHLLVQLAVILGACRLVGAVLRRLGQTQVASDMVAGFLLGPTLLGLMLPGVQHWLFPTKLVLHAAHGGGTVTIPHPSLTVLYEFGQLGLVLYMFLVGLSFDTKILSGHLGRSIYTSLAGVITPIVLGGAVGWAIAGNRTFFTSGIASWQGAVFFGAAIAITAFPMLARIIYESGLTRTRVGTMALACAAIDDAAAWILLAVVVSTTSHNPIVAGLALGGAVVYFLFAIGPGRILARRLGNWAVVGKTVRPEALIVTSVLVLLGSAFTEQAGVYNVFGAFVAGAVMPRGVFADKLRQWMEPVTVYVLLPTFFVYSGLNTHLNLLFTPVIATLMGVTLVVSFVSKGGACYAVCRVNGVSKRESASLAVLMNARGLMELILLNIGLEKGIITPALYTVLAVMTVVTTLAASPLYMWVQKRWRGDASDFSATVSDGDEHLDDELAVARA